MSRYNELKDALAKESGFINWAHLLFNNNRNSIAIENACDEVAKRYAKECSQASLEKASERTKILFDPKFNGYKGRHLAITNPENIILL